MRKFLARYASRCTRAQHAMLLPIQSTVSARHLLPLARLASSLGIEVHYTLSKRVARGVDAPRIRARFSAFATEASRAFAHAHRWKLVVVADHGYFQQLLLTGSPVVHIGHGNPSKTGTCRSHLPWEYGHAPRNRHGAIAYSEMIEASDPVKAALDAVEPGTGTRIRVLGRLLDDEMLEQRQHHRALYRHQWGVGPDRPVLLVASTIRTHSLFGMYWQPLLAQLHQLQRQYHVLLCPHPAERETWRARLPAGSPLQLLRADVSGEQALAAADVMLSDFSSLCQKTLLMDVPLVLARSDDSPLWNAGATRQLYRRCPLWDGNEPLEPLLAKAAADSRDDLKRDVGDWVNSRPGQARALHAAWLRRYFPATVPAATTASLPRILPEPAAAAMQVKASLHTD